MVLTEVYLKKKCLSSEDWLTFIKVISKYNGIFKKWKIIVQYEENQFRYFIETHSILPPTINGLENILLKQVDRSFSPNFLISFPYFKNGNIIDIMNYCEVKKQYQFERIEIIIHPIYQNYFLKKTHLFLKQEDTLLRRRKYFSIPQSILSIDFEKNNRFSYKKPPKYFNILKHLHLFKDNDINALLKVDTFPYLQGNYYLKQGDYNFDRHSLIMGSSGCGKSKFISLFVNNILRNSHKKEKYKIVIIDPHASLEQEIGGIEDTSVIDFKTKNNSIDLFMNHDSDFIATTELLMSLFKNLLQDQYNSKLERMLRHSIHLLLIYGDFSFVSLRKLLLDIEYRFRILKSLENQLPDSINNFFLTDFNELKTKSYGEAISPIISFIDEMEMVPVFNQGKIENSLEKTIKENALTIFSLDRVKLGDKIIKTISGLIMQQMLQLIIKKEIDEHIIFIIDEIAVVENPILCRFLSEARKYGLSLIMAGQYLNQISEEVKHAIFANTVNYYTFRISKADANLLVDYFNMDIPLNNEREYKVKLLTELNNRECIVRIASNDILFSAFKAKTLDFKAIPKIDKNNFEEEEVEKKKKKDIIFSLDSNTSIKDLMQDSSSSRKKLR